MALEAPEDRGALAVRAGLLAWPLLRPMSWLSPRRTAWGALACCGVTMDWERLFTWVEPHDSPMAPAAAVTPRDTGMPGRAQKIPPACEVLRPCVIPFSGTGVLAANAGAATPAGAYFVDKVDTLGELTLIMTFL